MKRRRVGDGTAAKRRAVGVAIGCAGVAVAAAAVLAGCAPGSTLRRIRADGVIRIGYALEAPYAFLRADGELTGESIEVARSIVHRLDIPRIEWLQTDFSVLIPELEARRFDAIAAGLFITPERARLVAFSNPSFRVAQALLVASGNPKGLHSYRQAAERPDVRIAAVAGAVEADLLARLGVSLPRLVIVPDALTGRAAVETGVVDGLALSSPSVQWMAKNAGGATEAAAPFAQEETGSGWGTGAFAFRKGDRLLLRAWNAAMEGFIGSPEHLRLIEGFGFRGSDLPTPADRRREDAR